MQSQSSRNIATVRLW